MNEEGAPLAALLGVCLGVLLVGLAYAAGREVGHGEGFARGLTVGARMAASHPEGETRAALTRCFDHLRTDNRNLEDRRD